MAALPIIMAAGSAVSAGISYQQQVQQASAMKEQQKRNNEALHNDMIAQYSSMSNAERQGANMSLEQGMDVRKDALRRKSEISLMSSSSGTSGISITNMFKNVDRATGTDMDTLFRNREVEQSNLRDQAASIRTGAIRNTDTRVIQKPNAVAAMLDVASSAGSGYMQGSAVKKSWDAR